MFRNLHLKLFALGLSFLFWMFVVSIENVFTVLPHEIHIQSLNVSDDLAFASELPTVKVTIRAESADFFRKLEPSDFMATIDLEDFGAGEHSVEVSVESRKEDVRVTRIQPAEVTVKLESVREELIPLTLELKGMPKSDYSVTETKLSQTFVRARGASSAFQKLGSAKAVITFDGLETESFVRKPELLIKDREGKEVTNLLLGDNEITVDVTIEQRKIQKQLPVKVITVGSPVSSTIQRIEANPSSILIEGDKEKISGILVIETEPVNLAAASGIVKKKVKLVLPDGLTALDASEAEVTIEIIP